MTRVIDCKYCFMDIFLFQRILQEFWACNFSLLTLLNKTSPTRDQELNLLSKRARVMGDIILHIPTYHTYTLKVNQ